MTQQLIFTNHVAETLDKAVEAIKPAKIFILVDFNTATFVLPRLQSEAKTITDATVITTKAGDMNKDLDALQTIWRRLTNEGCTRDSMLINVGGGVVTDIGAFAASTFKRGIRFINLPTTLLGAVDASVGGKTGINFNNIKNLIGSFAQAETVIISTTFFNTLNDNELWSGYAEMLKHGLLDNSATLDRLLSTDVTDIDPDRLLSLLKQSVNIKRVIVEADPTETGLRKTLNLGHTAGHAFESLAMSRKSPIAHGYAVAYGLITPMVLSHLRLGFPTDTLNRVTRYIIEHYGIFSFNCDDYPALLGYMSQDKKNRRQGEMSFTLLKEVGQPLINQIVTADEVRNALDITRDLMGI